MATNNIPALAECKPGIKPTGFNVLVCLPPKETTTAGGIILPDTSSDRERLGEVRGRLVGASPAAFDFATFPDGERPSVGDAVIFAKFAGIITEGDDGKEYRLLLDKDISAIIEEAA